MSDQERTTRDDEALSALLDGELPEDEAERLRQRLAREPALAARLEALEHADARVRGAYEGLVDEPVPQSVLDLLQPADGAEPSRHGDAAVAHPEPEAGTRTADVVELRPRAREPRRWFSVPAAAAAGIALVVGVLVGSLMGPGDSAPRTSTLVAGAGVVEPGTPLHDALQSAPSAETRELGADLSATPALTFRAQNGDYCRQVDLTSAAGRTETLACRRAGRWRVEVASFVPQPAEADGGVYRPAAGDSPVRAAVDSMIEGAPLDADTEQSLIASGWESP